MSQFEERETQEMSEPMNSFQLGESERVRGLFDARMAGVDVV